MITAQSAGVDNLFETAQEKVDRIVEEVASDARYRVTGREDGRFADVPCAVLSVTDTQNAKSRVNTLYAFTDGSQAYRLWIHNSDVISRTTMQDIEDSIEVQYDLEFLSTFQSLILEDGSVFRFALVRTGSSDDAFPYAFIEMPGDDPEDNMGVLYGAVLYCQDVAEQLELTRLCVDLKDGAGDVFGMCV